MQNRARVFSGMKNQGWNNKSNVACWGVKISTQFAEFAATGYEFPVEPLVCYLADRWQSGVPTRDWKLMSRKASNFWIPAHTL